MVSGWPFCFALPVSFGRRYIDSVGSYWPIVITHGQHARYR